MKIVVIGPHFPDSFARNICSSLEEMGHEVLSLAGTRVRHIQNRYVSAFWRFLPKLVPTFDERMHSGLISELSNFHPHAVLVTYDFFSPEVVERLKNSVKAPVFCWYIDHVGNLRNGSLLLCPYDAFFCKEPQLVETMTAKLGLPAFYLPEACNPKWHRPVTPTQEQRAFYGCDIASQGSLHHYRAKFFEALTGFDVKIWGPLAPAEIRSSSRRFVQGHYVAEQEKSIAFRSAKILVNCMNYAEARGVNNALFEGMGCGAFQICDNQPTLAEFFKPGKEVETFRDRFELIEKIRYFLKHPDERNEISERAWQRAHREHTYQNRLEEMFRVTKLN
jgi:spore maturation protein CgeB